MGVSRAEWARKRPARAMLCPVVVVVVVLGGWLGATTAAATAGGSDSCPAVCNCKWRSGKKSVECGDKALITIPEGIDPQTQLLDMSGNNLQTLPSETFVRAALLDLQKVYLRDCQIGQMDERALRGLSNVVDLDLSRNLLTSVPSAVLEDVPNLRNLSLARNPIKKIDAAAFRHVAALTKLDLSHCSLALVAARAFDGVEYLQLLRLNGNELSELRLDTADTLASLHGIELHDNPWRCDCGLRALKLWLGRRNVPYPIEPVCAGGPARLANRPFGQLQADDFACKPEIKAKPDHRYVESAVGENATALCRVEAVPRANVTWYLNGRPILDNAALDQQQQRRVRIAESGGGGDDDEPEHRSTLTLSNAQESDSSLQLYCVAENRAGVAEANFTLRVVRRLAGFPFAAANAHATLLSGALVAVILLVLASIAYLLFRIRKMPAAADSAASAGHLKQQQQQQRHAHQHRLANGVGLGVAATLRDHPLDGECVAATAPTSPYSAGAERSHLTAAQTRPRLPDGVHPYATAFEEDASLADDTRHRRQRASNPDLIADASQKAGEYTRATNHHDRFYPPCGLWDRKQLLPLSPDYGGVDPAVYGSAWTAPAPVGCDYRDTDDKTPIIEEVAFYESQLRRRRSPSPPPPPRQPAAAEQPQAREFAASAASPTAELSPGATTPTSVSAQPSAKTIRIWQKGVQVLPPVTALKRVLNRNSPDEGYQEGCGTDV